MQKWFVKKVWEKVEEDLAGYADSVVYDSGKVQIVPQISLATKSAVWYKLREGLSEVLPQDCLKLGHNLQDLVQEEDGRFCSPNFTSECIVNAQKSWVLYTTSVHGILTQYQNKQRSRLGSAWYQRYNGKMHTKCACDVMSTY